MTNTSFLNKIATLLIDNHSDQLSDTFIVLPNQRAKVFLIEAIKNQHSTYKILLTFYSPSGYEVRKNYPLADCICYLPLDTKKNAKTFIDIVNPSITFFVKYDFWANYLNELQSKNLKHYVIAAIFRENQYFFQKRNKWMLNILSKVDHYFVQNENSRNSR